MVFVDVLPITMFLTIDTTSVAKAWAMALQRVFFEGDVIKSEYDSGNDFPTRDSTSAIHVSAPLSDPFAIRGKTVKVAGETIFCHAGDVYCIEAIKGGYLTEVMAGDRDKNIWESETSYPYTYHDRLFNYKAANIEDESYLKGVSNDMLKALSELPGIDQIAHVIEKLKEAPHSRRAQAITWRPMSDPDRDDPPCLQRMWFRVHEGKLRMNTHWRSRDLFGAWEANINGMLLIAKRVADALKVEVGEYTDFCDSLHVYGRRKLVFKEVLPLLERIRAKEGLLKPEYSHQLDQWLEKMKNEPIE
jgi:thymidylate synthase